MHVELLMVGAHNGREQQNVILAAASRGPVILVEPVPYLFDQLVVTFSGLDNIYLEQKCVADKSGKIAFFATSPDSNAVAAWGDQLGSMNRDHAVLHNPAFASYVSEIEVDSITFHDLILKYDIKSIGTLFTDTEGFDTTILSTFPFNLVVPDQIIFEYKHSDGVFNIGRKFGLLISCLDLLGYNISVTDSENCIATRRNRV